MGKENKIKKIEFRCTIEEYKQLESKSEGFDNMSAFIRQLVFSKSQLIIEPKALIHTIDSLAKEINMVGNNLNQTTRYINYAEKKGVVSFDILQVVRNDYRKCRNEMEKIRVKLEEFIKYN